MTTPQPRPAADVMRELGALEAKATAAPWYSRPATGGTVFAMTTNDGKPYEGTVGGIPFYGNRDLVLTARNSLRYLLAAEAEMRAWRLNGESGGDHWTQLNKARAATDAAAREIGVVVT